MGGHGRLPLSLCLAGAGALGWTLAQSGNTKSSGRPSLKVSWPGACLDVKPLSNRLKPSTSCPHLAPSAGSLGGVGVCWCLGALCPQIASQRDLTSSSCLCSGLLPNPGPACIPLPPVSSLEGFLLRLLLLPLPPPSTFLFPLIQERFRAAATWQVLGASRCLGGEQDRSGLCPQEFLTS